MIFKFGRKNLALTVMVPYSCANGCLFCTSRTVYDRLSPCKKSVKQAMLAVLGRYPSPVQDVVFSGGEPMANIDVLRDLVEAVPARYNIYINTTFTNLNLRGFVDLVNQTDTICGVNISRHHSSYAEDCQMLSDIAPDECIQMIHKPVRINCVLLGQSIRGVIDRWKEAGVDICFRQDFTEDLSDQELHNPYNATSMQLLDMGFRYRSRTACNVCDTVTFERNGLVVSHHKGKRRSSIASETTIEINDLIVDPAGHILYDWEGCCPEIMPLLQRWIRGSECESLSSRLSNHAYYCGGSSGC